MAPPTQQQQQQQQAKLPDQIDTKLVDLGHGKGRILCIADIRGDIEQLNRLVRETGAVACIHTGDFGLYERQSIERISDKTLKHLLTYSPLLPPALRTKLLSPSLPRRELVQALAPNADDFHLSQFPLLFGSTPRLKLIVPTFVVYGACEDVRVVEKFRTGEYAVNNLTILDEATTRALDVGGVRLRLLGLGGAVVMAKMFDNGEGNATIAGGQGTMWTTALQIGELVDTAQRVYDPTETRILITHSSLGREPLLSLLSLALKADLTISSGLHFRYGAGWNEFSVQDEGGSGWWGKVTRGRKRWEEVWGMVRAQVEAVIEPSQKAYLDKTLAVFARAPPSAGPNAGPSAEESAWKNTWSWNLTDSTFGHLVLDIEDGKVGAEQKSQGFNFSHRRAAPSVVQEAAASAPVAATQSRSPAPAAPSASPSATTAPSAFKGLAAPRAANNASPTASAQQQQPNGPKGRKTPVGGQAQPPSPAPASNGGGPKIELKPLAGGNGSQQQQQQQQQHKKSESTSTAATSKGAKNGASPGPPAPTQSPAPSTSDAPAASASSRKASTTSNRQAHPPHTLFVNGLPVPVTEVELREYFGEAASGIASVRFMFDGKGEQKKFAYASFKDEAALNAALTACSSRQIRGVSPKTQLADPTFVVSGPATGATGSNSADWTGSTRSGRGGKGRGGRGDLKAGGGGRGGRGGKGGNGGGEGGSAESAASSPAPPAASAPSAGGDKKD